MSDPQPIPPPENDDAPEGLSIDLETVVSAFLAAFPTPSDEQLHQFATLLGIDYKVFEEQVFKMFGEALQQEDLEDILDDEEGIIEDELDLFIVSFFTFKADPTEEEIHALSEMIGVDPKEIEERVYRMLQEFEGSDDEDGDEDDLELDDPTDDDDQEEGDEEEEGLDPDDEVDTDDESDDDQSDEESDDADESSEEYEEDDAEEDDDAEQD